MPLVMTRIVASCVLITVLVYVNWRPRKLSVAVPAVVGAMLVIITGLVPLSTLLAILADTWDASTTLIALFLLSEALDSNGFFSWAALHLARLARGSGCFLYVLMLLLTVATTALLANDGAILILTPIFAQLLVKIYADEKHHKQQWLPFVCATGFLADAASALFIPSNLTNIIIADANTLDFTSFARWMIMPVIMTVIVVSICFGIRFRAMLSSRYDQTCLEEPVTALHDRHFLFWASWAALLVLIIGYIVGGQLHLPISYIAGPVALAMVALIQIRGIRPVQKILLAAPWSILLYALGMFIVITAAFNTGILSLLTVPFQRAITGSHSMSLMNESVSGVLQTGGIAAVLSAAANNLPATLIAVLVLRNVDGPSLLAVYAIILGVDIGPKLTPYGSLATLLWLGILARNGIHISWRRYFLENWWVTCLALLASFAGLLLSWYCMSITSGL